MLGGPALGTGGVLGGVNFGEVGFKFGAMGRTELGEGGSVRPGEKGLGGVDVWRG